MKKIFCLVQYYFLHSALIIISSFLLFSCNDKSKNLFYYSGDQKIGITISGDTLGFLLKDTVISDPSDTSKPFKSAQEFADASFNMQGYTSAGFLTDDSIEYRQVKLLIDSNKNANLREKEQTAQVIKNRNSLVVRYAGYLIRTKETNTPFILTDEMIIEFKPDASQNDITNLLQRYGLQIRRRNPFVKLQFTVASTNNSPTSILEISHELKDHQKVKFAQLNLIHIKKFHSEDPRDEYFLRQWHHRNEGLDTSIATEDADIDADLAWDFTKGSNNIILAIFDYDMDILHEDLKDNFAYNRLETPWNNFDDDANGFIDDTIGWDFTTNHNYLGVECAETPQDCFGFHGTAVMGVAAAVSNDIGVTGSCPDCNILPIRTNPVGVFDADIISFGYAKARGAKIFVLCWDYNGGQVPAIIVSAISSSIEAGICVFIAMTNSEMIDCNPNGLTAIPNTISISRSNSKDKFAPGGRGECLDLLAPTSSTRNPELPKIVTTDYMGDSGISYINESTRRPEDNEVEADYISLNYTTSFGGTSAATPLTAGVAGLILSANYWLTPKQVQYLLQDCADKIENSAANYSARNGKSQNETHGYGRLNAYEAVKIASPDLTKGGRNGVDIFLRDNELDWGNTEKPSSYLFEPIRATQSWWKSQDIKVDAPDASSSFSPPSNSVEFEDFPDESPVGGKINKVYVRVRNRGFRTANSIVVKLYWVHAGAGLPLLPSDFWDRFQESVMTPSEWNSLGEQPIFNLEYSGESVAIPVANPNGDKAQIVSFDFPAPIHDPSTRNHYCLMAIISSPDDLMPTKELKSLLPESLPDEQRLNMDYITAYYNNATHRNYNIVTEDEAFSSEFFMYNPSAEATYSKLEVNFRGQKIPVHFSDSLEGKLVFLKKNEKKLVTLNIDPRSLKEPTEITIQQLMPGKKKDEFKVIGGISYFIVPSSKKSSASKSKK